MAQNFMGPSQMMGQQLSGALQAASESAANQRAAIAAQQFEQAKMAKDMEVNFQLAEKLYATDKVEALKYFNAGLHYLGRSATMEQFDPAFKLFQAAAEAKQQNDPVAMGLILKQAAGKLTNVADMQRAASMETWAQQEIAKRQAQVVTDLQPEPARLGWARELTQMGEALQQGALSPGLQEKMVALTGTDNQEEWRNQYIQADAIIKGQDKKRDAYQRAFSLNPKAFDVASQQLAHGFSNVQDAALARISDLAMQETRTPEEEREYQAKMLMFPHLAAAAGMKTAQSELERRQTALADTQQRLGAIDVNLSALKNATSGAASVDTATAGLPSAGEPLPDAAARDHLLAQGVRDTEWQLFSKQHEGTIAQLEQMAAGAEQQISSLHIMAMARPGQREAIDERIRELEATAKAARAQARLFRDENGYILSQRRAEIDELKGRIRSKSTSEGRPFVPNDDGTISTEYTATVTDDRINGGQPTNIPTIFNGKRVSVDDAIERIVKAGGIDPETKRSLLPHQSIAEAEEMAKVRSRSLDPELQQNLGQLQSDFYDKQQALTELEIAQKKDLAIVEQERNRLAQREAMLQSRMTADERKAAEEKKMMAGIEAVIAATAAGQSQPKAVAEVSKRIGLNAGDLSKKVTEFRGSGVFEAQSDYAAKLAAYARAHNGEMPKQGELFRMKAEIVKRTGVDMKELETVEREPPGRKGGGLDSKDLQQMYTNVLNAAAKLSGETGMRFSTDSSGMAQFEMGTIKDVKALAEKMVLLAEEQSFLPQQVREALLKTAQRLGGTPTAAVPAAASAPATISPADRERAIREKLQLK